MVLNLKKLASARPVWVAAVCAAVVAAHSTVHVAFAEPDDDDDKEERKPRVRERGDGGDERKRIERELRERRERSLNEDPDDRRRDEEIHRLERALDEARERQKKGGRSGGEIEDIEHRLRELRGPRRRGHVERREVRIVRRSDALAEQRELIQQQIALLDEALEQQEIRREAGSVDAGRLSDLRMQRLQFERELIHHSAERGEREWERERDIVREQIEIVAQGLKRLEARSQFLDKPGEGFELKMRLLGLRRELAGMNASTQEVRIHRREIHETRGAHGEFDEQHREYMERHERAVLEHQERAQRLHEQADRRMKEAMETRERQLRSRREGAGSAAKERQAGEAQRAKLERLLEEERERREDLEAELKELRNLLNKQRKEKAKN